MVLVVGTGHHVDPVAWHGGIASVPARIVQHFRALASLMLDCGAGRATLMALGVAPRLRLATAERDWEQDVPQAALLQLRIDTRQHLLRVDQDCIPAADWDAHLIIIASRFPLNTTDLTARSTALADLIRGIWVVGDLAAARWLVVADNNSISISSIHDGRVAATLASAAAGRLAA